MTSKYYILLKNKWTNKTQVAFEFLNFCTIAQDLLIQRWTSKYYALLKSKWTNKTQVALEFLNFHIIAQDFSFLTG
jgi:fructose-1,6-bisphosphatase